MHIFGKWLLCSVALVALTGGSLSPAVAQEGAKAVRDSRDQIAQKPKKQVTPKQATPSAVPAPTVHALVAEPEEKSEERRGNISPELYRGEVSFGIRMFRALDDKKTEADVTFALLRDAVNSLGGVCAGVLSYQPIERSENLHSQKILCSARPVYFLIVQRDGNMTLEGGNGRVPSISEEDGPILTASGDSTWAKINPDGQVAPLPVSNINKYRRTASMQTRETLLGLGLGILLVMVALGLLAYRRFYDAGNSSTVTSKVRRFSSETKDQMIRESTELYPDFWEHPSGIYIVRGRHGKRRVFARHLFALLYYRWGLKISQLR